MIRTRKLQLTLFAGLLAALVAAPVHAQSPSLVEVLQSAPGASNSVLYADFPALLKLTGDGIYNAEALQKLGEARIAGELNLAFMSPNWEVGFVNVPNMPAAKDIAALKKGYVEEVQGKSVIWTPDSGYLVPMENNVVGIVRPANRQVLGSWLKKGTKFEPSAFLKKSAEESTQFISMMLAIDLRDWLSPSAAKPKLASMDFLRDVNLDDMSKLLADIQGVKVIVGRRNLDECIVTLEFGSNPKILLPHAAKIFEEVLARSGVSLSEAQGWKATMQDNTLSLRGRIEPENIDMMLDSFSIQRRNLSHGGSGSTDPAADKAAIASVTFFHSVTDITKKVRDYTRRNGASTSVAYNDRMARRIDELPSLDVDPALLDYASQVSNAIRGFVVSARGTNIQSGVGQMTARSTNTGIGQNVVPVSAGVGWGNAWGGFGGGYVNGYYGWYNPNANLEVARGIDAQAKGQNNTLYGTVTQSIDGMTAQIRRAMTEKYKIQF